MVGVAQLVELRIVIPVVAGSNPVVHPKLKVRTGKRDWQRSRQKVCPYKPRRSPQIEGEDWEEGSPPLIQQTCESGGIGRRAGFRYQYRKM